MKFIGPDAARTIAIVAPEEMRPTTGNTFLPAFIALVRERYHFQLTSDPSDAESDPNNVIFKIGVASFADGRTITIQQLTILPNAAIVDTLTSEEGDLILDDLLTWAKEAFGWRDPIYRRVRWFSSVVVEFERNADALFSGLEAVCRFLTQSFEESLDEPYHVRSIVLGSDPMRLPVSSTNPEFSIQRRLDIPYHLNRFYCNGPFPTDKLVKILETTERLLMTSEGK